MNARTTAEAAALQEKRMEAIRRRQQAAVRRFVLFGVELVALAAVGICAAMSLFSVWFIAIPLAVIAATFGLGAKASSDGRKADALMVERIRRANGESVESDAGEEDQIAHFPVRKVYTPTEIEWTTRTTEFSRSAGEEDRVFEGGQARADAGQEWKSLDSVEAPVARDDDGEAESFVDESRSSYWKSGAEFEDNAFEADAATPADHEGSVDERGRVHWEPQSIPRPMHTLKPAVARREIPTGVIRQVNAVDDATPSRPMPHRPKELSDDVRETRTSAELAGGAFSQLDEILERRRAVNA